MAKAETSTETVAAPTFLQRKFADDVVNVPVKFITGHVLTEGEAKWASSQFATVIGNAYGGLKRRMGDIPADFNPQATIDEMVAAYVFGGSTRGVGTPSDPVSQLVNTLATIELKARIAKKGLKVMDFYKAKNEAGVSKFAELLAALIEQKGDAFRAQAQAQLAAMADEDEATDDLLDGVELTSEPPEAEAEAA